MLIAGASLWPSPVFPAGPLLLWLLAAGLGLASTAWRPRQHGKALLRGAYACGAAGGLCGLTGAIGLLAAPVLPTADWWGSVPPIGTGGPLGEASDPAAAAARAAALVLRLDPLAAFFGALLCGVAAAVSVYALGYRPGHHALAHAGGPVPHGGPAADRALSSPAAAPGRGGVPPTGEGRLAAGNHLFLAAMLLVILADSVLAFLLAWEAMSLLSYFLVLYDHEDPVVRRAGFVYLVMTHAGTAFILGAFLLVAGHAGGFTFEALRAAGHADGTAAWKTVAFLFALVGFGTKAGLLPLHVWLPRAHPAAPTHVSALMSGVMVKTGIYGLVRFGWDLLGAGRAGVGDVATLPPWVGWLVVTIGVASAVLGVLHALMEHDLKRLLAYHTVENIGIIAIGLGASLVLSGTNTSGAAAGAAAVALGAALFHTLNHAIFKSLLFLGAGAVQQGTGTRNLEHMGGLIRPMPWTAAAFLIGSMAISGLPPLNGFASEWLTFQSLLAVATACCALPLPGGPGGPSWQLWQVGQAVGGIAAGALLGLTAALAVACFVKAFAAAFLALPRHQHAAAAQEVPLSMRWGMGALAAACVVLGLGAASVQALVVRAIEGLVPQVPRVQASTVVGLGLLPGGAVLAAPGILAALVAAGALAFALRRGLGRNVQVRRAPTWACGVVLEPQMEYTPTSFAKPIRVIFAWALQPFRSVEPEYAPGAAPYFLRTLRYELGTRPVIEHGLYRPAVALLIRAAQTLRRVQSGSLRAYLGYLLAALVVLLLWGR